MGLRFTGWKQLASQFVNDDHVIFDLQNEPHDIPAATVAQLVSFFFLTSLFAAGSPGHTTDASRYQRCPFGRCDQAADPR